LITTLRVNQGSSAHWRSAFRIRAVPVSHAGDRERDADRRERVVDEHPAAAANTRAPAGEIVARGPVPVCAVHVQEVELTGHLRERVV
jgi:hypothetical protein